MPHEHTPNQSFSPELLERIAQYLQRTGLATPALLLLEIARPLGVFGSQCLTLLQPLAPEQRWQNQINQIAQAMEDDATWTRLENLLK
jgi:hypothetical protein